MPFSEKEENLKRRRTPRLKTLEKGIFFVFLISALFSPGAVRAGQESASGTIAVRAAVPFQEEFADAVAGNSEIHINYKFTSPGQDIIVTANISNGETTLKNQILFLEIRNQKGEIIYSGRYTSGQSKKAEWKIPITQKMTGKNSISCRIETYAQPIILEKRIKFFVWPDFKKTFTHLQKEKIAPANMTMLILYI